MLAQDDLQVLSREYGTTLYRDYTSRHYIPFFPMKHPEENLTEKTTLWVLPLTHLQSILGVILRALYTHITISILNSKPDPKL